MKNVLLKIALLIAMCMPIQSMADTYRLILMDTTGSMTEPHNSGTKWDAAKTVAALNITSVPGWYNALWQIHGADSGLVAGFDWEKSTVVPANDVAQKILNKINDPAFTPVTGPNTPLADILCKAVAELESKGTATDTKYLILITDGGENSSGYYTNLLSQCSDFIHDYPENTYPFAVDATSLSYYEDQKINAGDPTRSYAPIDTIFPDWMDTVNNIDYTGRAYNTGSGINYDWSAGTEIGSWEWRMYYRVARNNIPVPSAGNKEWPMTVAETPTDVIFNITEFYNDVTTLPSIMTSLKRTVSASENVPSASVMNTRSKAVTRAITPSYTQGQIDSFTFTGLADLTKGRFIPAINGEDIPLIADINGDGNVNETDMRIVLTWFARPTDAYNPQSIDADLMGNGFIDNADMALIRTGWTDTTKDAPIMGDLDYNWCVDQSDINKVNQWLGKNVTPNSQESYYADINADGKIDAADLAIVTANKGWGCIICGDGWENSDESDIDCGGDVCKKCETGKSCLEGPDCLSNICTEYVCQAAPVTNLMATIQVTNSFATGYCANIEIKNNRTVATKNWNVKLNLNGATIYSKWNANFTANSGNITVTPVSWNKVIGAGQKITSPGFCVNKGTATASVTSATGTY